MMGMIKLRDLIVSVTAVLATLAVLQFTATAREDSPLMNSAVLRVDTITPTPTDVGSRRSIVRAATATLDELESHVTTLNPGQWPHPPHQHVNEELIIVTQGSIEAYIEGTWTPVPTGSIAFMASNHRHTVRNVSNAPATYYVINWASPGMLKKGASAQ
jgi:XRE family transcriptional regulator, regulator of sulfur utilization